MLDIANRRMSDDGIDLLKLSEELRLRAYLCPAGVPTIGWGCTHGVTMGMTITVVQTETMLRAELASSEAAVTAMVSGSYAGTIQGQFDALVVSPSMKARAP